MDNKIKAIIAVAVVAVGMIGYTQISKEMNKDPEITGLQAEFVGKVGPGGSLSKNMFKVTGTTEAGKVVQINDFSSKTTTAAENGASCEVNIEAQGQSATVIVDITREPVLEENIGYPNEKSAKVTYHQEDIVQDVWIKIFSELKNYDPDKGAITTFIAPWIRHVVSDYASKNFRKTSVYYANAMKKINGAQNYCKQYGLNADDIETIMSLTGLSEATVKNTLDLMSKKDSVSYEALIDAGADYTASIKGPEESVIESESEENLKTIW